MENQEQNVEPKRPVHASRSPLTCLLVVVAIIGVMIALLFPAVRTARERARRLMCPNNLHGIGIAFHNYHDTYGSFPPAYTVDKDGKPLHGWRVLLLPFLEQKELYDKIRLDEPWNSEHNRQFHELRLSAFQCPSRPRDAGNLKDRLNNCDYSVIVGDETVFPGSKSTSFKDITDGTSNTILAVERMVPICWMDPNDEIRFDTAWEGINRHLLGIGSEHPGGANVALVDASVKFLSNFVFDDPPMRALLMRAGHNKFCPTCGSLAH